MNLHENWRVCLTLSCPSVLLCSLPPHSRQFGVWFRIWVGGILCRNSWMAACANLGGKGQYGLAFLPREPHRLVIGTICQAERPLHNVLFSAQSSHILAHRKVKAQLLSARIQRLKSAAHSSSPITFLHRLVTLFFIKIFKEYVTVVNLNQ